MKLVVPSMEYEDEIHAFRREFTNLQYLNRNGKRSWSGTGLDWMIKAEE